MFFFNEKGRKPKMNWRHFFNGAWPIIGVIVGGGATYLTQTHAMKRQLKKEEEKENEAKIIERLSIYSEILKLEGESLMIEYVGGGMVDFNLKSYSKKFRPVLFSKFYLLDQVVADKIREMDNIIGSANFQEELERDQNDELLSLFNQLVSAIESDLKNFRKK